MNTTHSLRILASALVVAFLLLSPLASVSAQTTPPPQCEHHHCHQHGWKKGCEGHLTPAECQQLTADMKKVHGDAQLVSAQEKLVADWKSLHQTERDLLLKADPSIKLILDKIHNEARWMAVKQWFGHLCPFGHSKDAGMRCHGGPEHWANLTAAEQQHLKADMEKVQGDPQLQLAWKNIKTDKQALHQIKEALLLKVDPSIKPVLDKLNADHLRKGRRGEWCHSGRCHKH